MHFTQIKDETGKTVYQSNEPIPLRKGDKFVLSEHDLSCNKFKDTLYEVVEGPSAIIIDVYEGCRVNEVSMSFKVKAIS